METVRTVRKARGKLIYTLFREVRAERDVRYGISITSLIFGTSETAEAKELTADLSAAEEILNMLAENDVLPSMLNELAEECAAAFAL